MYAAYYYVFTHPFASFFGGLALLLWPASVLSILAYRPFMGDISNLALAIILILVILGQGAFSMYQDWSTSKVMDSIKHMLPQEAPVFRNGVETKIPVSDMVVGDLVKLEVGDRAPADVRIIECHGLKGSFFLKNFFQNVLFNPFN